MRYSTQILGAIASSTGMLIFGNSVGFATIALPQLLNESDPNVQMDQNLGSWFASILWICGLFLAPLGGILSGKLGRRTVILYFSPLVLLGWILMGVAYNNFMIFTARIITTSCVYIFVSSLGVYISETVEPSIRSTLVILPVCFVASGQFLVWLLGYLVGTVFENHPKMSHLSFSILAFSTNFCPFKMTCLVTLFDRKLQIFKTSPKIDHFWPF